MENKKVHKTSIGGQALIEGIMMRGPKGLAMSVRLPNGEISTEYKNFTPITSKHKLLRVPIIRGVAAFADSMITGYKCLMDSAEKAGMDLDEEEESKAQKFLKNFLGKAFIPVIILFALIFACGAGFLIYNFCRDTINADNGIVYWLAIVGTVALIIAFLYFGLIVLSNIGNNALKNAIGVISIVFGLFISVFLFMYLPSFLFDLFNTYVFPNNDISSWRAVFEGVIKIAVFVLYIFLVSRMKDIKRLFMYHGAEHKTIFCYEHANELTVENIKKERRFHPRCGTSFLLIMLIVGIIISIVISNVFSSLTSNRALWVFIKILLIPIIMGIGYECIKLAGRHDNLFTRIISAPGMWMQRLTTKEPDDDIIEVAIQSMLAVITDNPEDDEIK